MESSRLAARFSCTAAVGLGLFVLGFWHDGQQASVAIRRMLWACTLSVIKSAQAELVFNKRPAALEEEMYTAISSDFSLV